MAVKRAVEMKREKPRLKSRAPPSQEGSASWKKPSTPARKALARIEASRRMEMPPIMARATRRARTASQRLSRVRLALTSQISFMEEESWLKAPVAPTMSVPRPTREAMMPERGLLAFWTRVSTCLADSGLIHWLIWSASSPRTACSP